MNDKKLMNLAADNIRILAASMVEKANSGHPGGAMGGADFVNVLFSEFLVYDPENPAWEGRDRFFLDPGHMSPMLYSTLALTGKFTLDELKEFRQWGSPTPGHPERDLMRGIENTSGPLGQGHTFAVGAAIAAKFMKARFEEVMNQTIYAYISDGGVQEEISQGAGRIAGALGLDNLIMFYDANDIQLSTETKDVTIEDTAKKYEAWGWKVIKIDGNDADAIRGALNEAKAEAERPTLIIGHTVMGKGARKADGSSYEANCATHGAPLGGDAYVNTIKNLGGNPENPFTIFPEVAELYAKRAAELKGIMAEKYAAKAAWAKANPEKAAKLEFFFSGKAPEVNWAAIEQKANSATRAASATVLGALATQVENMVVASSDKYGNPSMNSNYGAKELDLYAPGVSVYAAYTGDTYQTGTGMGLASASVAGVAALIKAYYPNLTGSQIRDILLASVTSRKGVEVEKGIEVGGKKTQDLFLFDDLCLSGGILNAYQAVVAASKLAGK